MLFEFPTKVAGIPCLCDVVYYAPSHEAHIAGLPENCYPSEPTEFEFRLLDRRGYKAPWLERKLTDEDEERLLNEYEHTLRDIFD